MASGGDRVWLWTGASRSTEQRDGEDSVEEEERRGRSGGEAGGALWFSFSIMVVRSLEETAALLRPGCSVWRVSVGPAVFLYDFHRSRVR